MFRGKNIRWESTSPYCSLVEMSERKKTSWKRLSSCNNDSLVQGAATTTAFPYMVDSRAEGLAVILGRLNQFFLVILGGLIKHDLL